MYGHGLDSDDPWIIGPMETDRMIESAHPTAEMQQEVANNIKRKLESLPAPNIR